MKKDIKIAIIGLGISFLLLALGLVIIILSPISEIPNGIIRAIIGCLSLSIGFFLSVAFLALTITFICIEIHNKKADKYNAQLEEQIRNELPRNVEFSVNIYDIKNEEINEILHENLKTKALFDGENIYITFSLSDKVKVKTDILSFIDNFDY